MSNNSTSEASATLTIAFSHYHFGNTQLLEILSEPSEEKVGHHQIQWRDDYCDSAREFWFRVRDCGVCGGEAWVADLSFRSGIKSQRLEL